MPAKSWLFLLARRQGSKQTRKDNSCSRPALRADVPGMSPRSLLLLGAAFLPACADAGAAAEADQAIAVFTAFQQALQQGDASAAGRLLAADSQPVL